MMKLSVCAVLLLSVAGCSSVTAPSAPVMVGETWVFIGVDGTGNMVRSATLLFTDRPVRACIAGDWKEARVLTAVRGQTGVAAYILSGEKLTINLSEPLLCDNYEQMQGELTWAGFSGRYYSFGLGWSKDLGRGFGAPAFPK